MFVSFAMPSVEYVLPLFLIAFAGFLFAGIGWSLSLKCPYCGKYLWIKESKWFGEYSDLSIPDHCPKCNGDLREPS